MVLRWIDEMSFIDSFGDEFEYVYHIYRFFFGEILQYIGFAVYPSGSGCILIATVI